MPQTPTPTVPVKVLYFASAREQAGCDSEVVQLPAQTDTNAIGDHLASAHPQLRQLLAYSRIAVRQTFAKGAITLQANDEIAIIPPVSGG